MRWTSLESVSIFLNNQCILMKIISRSINLVLLCSVLSMSLHAPLALAKPIALLIGINEYHNVQPLEGAVNDVLALRDVLVKRWDFAATDIHTLLNEEATHANILRELAALKSRSSPNDMVLIYFSGHGTSALDANINLPLPYSSGAFVPVDFLDHRKMKDLIRENRLEDALIIGRTHLRPVFMELEKDRQVFVMADSCYSGNMARAIVKAGSAHFRYVAINLDDDTLMSTTPTPVNKTLQAEAFPYHHLIFLSAASDREPARDIRDSDMIGTPTLDGLPHGAFTDAVLRVLSGELPADVDNDGKINYLELHRAALQFMESRNYGHTPQRLPGLVEDKSSNASTLVFGKGMPKGGFSTLSATTKLQVRLAAPELKAKLEGIEGVRLVGAAEPAMLEVASSDGKFQLRAGSGDPIIKADEDVVMHRITAELWWRNLVAQARPEFQVNIETNPPTRGNTFIEGEKFVFNVNSSQPACLIILNIDPTGNVAVLYPQNSAQTAIHPKNRLLTLPEIEKIEVIPPFGMDQVVVLALPDTPENWQGITEIVDPVAIDHPRIRGLERLLERQHGRFAWQALSVRSYPDAR